MDGSRRGASGHPKQGRQRQRVHTRDGPETEQVRQLPGGEHQPGGGRGQEHQGRVQVDREQPVGLLVAPERAERALHRHRQHRPRHDGVQQADRGRAQRGHREDPGAAAGLGEERDVLPPQGPGQLSAQERLHRHVCPLAPSPAPGLLQGTVNDSVTEIPFYSIGPTHNISSRLVDDRPNVKHSSLFCDSF